MSNDVDGTSMNSEHRTYQVVRITAVQGVRSFPGLTISIAIAWLGMCERFSMSCCVQTNERTADKKCSILSQSLLLGRLSVKPVYVNMCIDFEVFVGQLGTRLQTRHPYREVLTLWQSLDLIDKSFLISPYVVCVLDDLSRCFTSSPNTTS
jgi:hypothetical protein